jgi:diaminopimelate decarboxylase
MFSLELHSDNLLNLADEVGSPFFFYDLDVLENKLVSLKKTTSKALVCC